MIETIVHTIRESGKPDRVVIEKIWHPKGKR